jgi:ubiquinone/menaquinone biosynthesis C-methylase UbiE
MKHEHSGKSSESILDSEKIIRELGVKDSDVFVDAGSGNGYFSLLVAPLVKKVYSFDSHEYSISSLKEKNVGNIVPILAKINDISLEKNSIDVFYLSNVLHGLVINEEFESSIKKAWKILKKGGKFGIVEFKKEETKRGPPIDVKLSPQQVEELIAPFGFLKTKVVSVGEMSYLIAFTKV